MIKAHHIIIVAALVTAGAPAPRLAAEAPLVVASIPPLHSLASGVMAGVGTPALIVRGAASAHHRALRPSEARALHRAEIVIWIGPALEAFLAKPIQSLAGKATIVTMLETPGLGLLAPRKAGLWAGDGASPDQRAEPGKADPHIWLDPENAKIMVGAIGAALAAKDPANGARYGANVRALQRRLDTLSGALRTFLKPVSGVPYLVYHDGFQYFEKRFGLIARGAVARDPDQKPGPKRMFRLRALIEAGRIGCIFKEPGTPASLIHVLTGETGVASAVLDPLGAGLAPGPDLYFTLMRANAGAFVRCLSGP
ncbi:MAG: zinc ABC transporter substrate-binding protein [Proteobacteria bacterium]|nr:zinc ABC transporter substrate-binding protein [Pseudomonadota bacterium]